MPLAVLICIPTNQELAAGLCREASMSVFRSTVSCSLLLSLSVGCGDKESASDSGSDAHGSDTAEDSSGDGGGDGDGSGGEDVTYASVADYIGAHCDAIRTRCGVYSSTEICVEDIMTNGYTGECAVVSQENGEAYVAFLEGVSCEEQTWTEVFDNVVDCE